MNRLVLRKTGNWGFLAPGESVNDDIRNFGEIAY